MKSCQVAPAAIKVTPFLTRAMGGDRIDLPALVLPEGEWMSVVFTVPDLGGDQVHDIGWCIEIAPVEPPWALGKVYIDDVTVIGDMDYTIDMGIQRMEFAQPTPFSVNGGEAAPVDGALCFVTDADGQVFTGNYYARDMAVEAHLVPVAGSSAGILLRGQGCRQYYEVGFAGENRISIARWEAGQRTELCGADFSWKHGEVYHLKAEARGEAISLQVNGVKLLEAQDGRMAYGMVGVCHAAGGESRWTGFHVTASMGKDAVLA